MITKNRPPFITGSRAYGTPKKDSDLDLVVCIEDIDLLKQLKEISDTPSKSLRFGNLNIIACDKSTYDKWEKGTEQLKKLSPVTRNFAISTFDKLGVSSMYESDVGDLLSPDKIEPVKNNETIKELKIVKTKKEDSNKIKRFEKLFEESNISQ